MKNLFWILMISIASLFFLISCSKNKGDPPKASYSVSSNIARIGDTIYFQNTSTDADDYEWDFGDGNGSIEENPSHVYAENGNFTVLLKVYNDSGTDEVSNSIRISSWSPGAEMPTPRGLQSSSVVNGKIYVISGSDHYGGGALHTVEEYNPETDNWSTKTDIPTARQGLTSSVVGGKIYAIGGGDSSNPTTYQDLEVFSSVEEYNPVTDTWISRSPMPYASWNHSEAVINDKIYIIGGTTTGPPFEPLLSMVVYDPNTDTWSSTKDIPRPVVTSEAVVVNRKIYVIGGDFEGFQNRVDEYDPETDTWTQKANMPTKRNDHSCCVLEGKIYATGGEDDKYAVINSVEVYDPQSDTWNVEDPLLRARWIHSSNVVDGKIYVIGGLSSSSPFSNYQGLKETEVYYK